MPVGGQPGNQNGANGAEWRSSLKRAMTRLSAKQGDDKPGYRQGMDRIADNVVQQAYEGNKDAWKEVADRIDGKAAQSVTVSGDAEKPLVTRIERVVLGNTSD